MPKRTVDLPVKVGSLGATDFLVLVDTVDTSDSPEGSDLRAPAIRVVTTDGNATQITNGGSINLGGHAVIVAKAGTIAMIDDLNPPHTHVEADITDLDKYTQAAVDALLADKAEAVHVHIIDDVTGLQAALDAKEDSLPVAITGTGSLDVGSGSLTANNKSGELALMSDVAAVASQIIHFGHTREQSSGTSYGVCYWGYFNPAAIPAGWTVKFGARFYRTTEGTAYIQLKVNDVVIAGSELTSVSPAEETQLSADLATALQSAGAGHVHVERRHSNGSGVVNTLSSWLLLEPPA